MTTEPGFGDQLVAWAYAAAIAAVGFLLLLVLGDFGIFAGAFLAGVLFVLVGGLISWLFCTPLPAPGTVPPPGKRVSTKPASASSKPVAAAPVAAPVPEPASAPKPAPAPEPVPAPADASSENAEAAGSASKAIVTQPEALAAPRDGGPDDLKEIKGVGPKLETLCHELGIYHFDQIAGWGPDEVAWMDENLKGFKGRVTRDNWIEQAKTLAAGGET